MPDVPREDYNIPRDEYRAAWETRRDLGSEMEPAVIDSFVDKVERTIDARVSQELAHRERDRSDSDRDSKRQMVLGIVTAGVAIPLTAIALALAHLPGLIVVWIGLVLINMAFALGKRRRN